MLAARIDRLGGQAKPVLGAASMTGGEFDRDLLERVAQMPANDLDPALEELSEAERIAQTEVYRATGEVGALIAQRYEQAGLALKGCTWCLAAANWALAID